jgi:hypothetical protein
MPDELENFRTEFDNKSDEELITIRDSYIPPHAMHLAAKQVLNQRENKQSRRDFSAAQTLSNQTLKWTKAGVLIAAIAMIAAIIAAVEGWK